MNDAHILALLNSMNSKVYKWCAVSKCTNTSVKTPNKLFMIVPTKKTTREKWLKLPNRDLKDISLDSDLYLCEDHFDVTITLNPAKKDKRAATKQVERGSGSSVLQELIDQSPQVNKKTQQKNKHEKRTRTTQPQKIQKTHAGPSTEVHILPSSPTPSSKMSNSHLTDYMKYKIIYMHEENIGIKEIARRLRINRNTVRLWIRRYCARGTVDAERSGPRPMTLTPKSQRNQAIIATESGSYFATTTSTSSTDSDMIVPRTSDAELNSDDDSSDDDYSTRPRKLPTTSSSQATSEKQSSEQLKSRSKETRTKRNAAESVSSEQPTKACDRCNTDIIGARLVCVECYNVTICSICEGQCAHAHHYMLKVPGNKSPGESIPLLKALRRQLGLDDTINEDEALFTADRIKEERLDPLEFVVKDEFIESFLEEIDIKEESLSMSDIVKEEPEEDLGEICDTVEVSMDEETPEVTSTPAQPTIVTPVVKPVPAKPTIVTPIVKPVPAKPTIVTPVVKPVLAKTTIATPIVKPVPAKPTIMTPVVKLVPVKSTIVTPVVKPGPAKPTIVTPLVKPVPAKPTIVTPVVKPVPAKPTIMTPVVKPVPAKPTIVTPVVKPGPAKPTIVTPVVKPVPAKPTIVTPVVKPVPAQPTITLDPSFGVPMLVLHPLSVRQLRPRASKRPTPSPSPPPVAGPSQRLTAADTVAGRFEVFSHKTARAKKRKTKAGKSKR